jgi:hypothetical protein
MRGHESALTNALIDLNLEQIWVVHTGKQRYRIHDCIECIGVDGLPAVRDLLA